jgi:hypothetical protein
MDDIGPDATRLNDLDPATELVPTAGGRSRSEPAVLNTGYALSERDKEPRLTGELRMIGEGGLMVDTGYGGGRASPCSWSGDSSGVGGEELFDFEHEPLLSLTGWPSASKV